MRSSPLTFWWLRARQSFHCWVGLWSLDISKRAANERLLMNEGFDAFATITSFKQFLGKSLADSRARCLESTASSSLRLLWKSLIGKATVFSRSERAQRPSHLDLLTRRLRMSLYGARRRVWRYRRCGRIPIRRESCASASGLFPFA